MTNTHPNSNPINDWSFSNNSIKMPALDFFTIRGGQTVTCKYSSSGHNQVAGELYINSDLLNKFENNMSEKFNTPKLQEKNIKSIRSILALIYNTFQSRSNSLHCFFTIGSNKDKTCFHYINSLPIIRFSLFNNSSTVVFSSDWNGTPKIYDGWDIVPSNAQETLEMQKNVLSYKAKSVFVIKDVKKINLYDWGFEIINDGGIQLNAILGYALVKKIDNIIEKQPYVHPFDPKIASSPNFMKLIANWSEDA